MASLHTETGLPIPLFDRTLLDRLLVFQTEDLGEVQRYVSSALCPHRLLSGKRKLQFHHYSALMRELGFNYLSYGRLDCPIDMEAPNLADSYMIRLAISGQCELRINRQTSLLSPGMIIVANPDGPVRTRMEGEYRHLTIKVPRAAFHRVLASELGHLPPKPLKFDSRPVNLGDEHAGLAGIIRVICDDLNSPMSPLSQERTGKHIERALLCSALCSLPNNYSARLKGTDRIALPHYMRTVIRFIEHRARAPITLVEMVEVSGVSTRSLHASFRKYLNTTPMNYLRNFRLDMAREELGKAVEEGRSVTDVAFDCGFTHLSKFAHDFRHRFGVLPSQLRSGLCEENAQISCGTD